MVEERSKARLGRGLAALLGEVGDEIGAIERARGQKRVPTSFLRPNPKNPRTRFDDAELDDLAASIREKGMLQPILARTVTGVFDTYEIIAGERRWRAAQRAGLHEVPVILIEASDREALELAIVENVQREDLNAVEEAAGYDRLVEEFGYSQNDLARVIGKSRSHVANTLRLLKLPDVVKRAVAEGQLTAGHARALLAMDDPAAMAERIIAGGLTVREAEALAQDAARKAGRRATPRPRLPKPADIVALEQDLADRLGLAVSIDMRGEAGEVRIRYRSLDQLEAVLRRLRD